MHDGQRRLLKALPQIPKQGLCLPGSQGERVAPKTNGPVFRGAAVFRELWRRSLGERTAAVRPGCAAARLGGLLRSPMNCHNRQAGATGME